MSTVTMVNSVSENVAGTEIELPDEIADAFIILGYAQGQLSRDYDEQEQQLIRARNQVVSV